MRLTGPVTEQVSGPVTRPVTGFVTAAVAAAALLSGCAGSASSPAGPAASSPSATTPAGPGASAGTGGGTTASPTATQGANVREIAVSIAGGKVSPEVNRVPVAKGQTVKITVSSDRADEIHVHGYDKEAEVKPGAPAVIQFAATQVGLFEVETHETKKVLFLLQVQ